MSKEIDKIIEALENISIKFDELGFSPTIPIPKGDKAHFVDWFKVEIDAIKVVTNKQVQRIAELEAKLAEKEKENLAFAHIITGWDDYNQDKIYFAVEQLEKVKELAEKEIKECNKLLQEEFEDDYYIQSVNARQSMCYEFRREIDNQIKQLKEIK